MKHLYEMITNPSDSDVFVPIRKRLKRLIINESSEEENMMRQSCVSWIWQKVKNISIIWKYSETRGKSISNNLSKNLGFKNITIFYYIR